MDKVGGFEEAKAQSHWVGFNFVASNDSHILSRIRTYNATQPHQGYATLLKLAKALEGEGGKKIWSAEVMFGFAIWREFWKVKM